MCTHAEGHTSHAGGLGSHAEGLGTVAYSNSQHAEGKYNIEDVQGKYIHIAGNGAAAHARSNAHTLDWSGNGWFAGKVQSTGADYAEFFEWADGNPSGEDRVGLAVALDGEKIRLANADDEILGIVSGTAAILGDSYESEWCGKYIVDEFGRYQYEMAEEFVDVSKEGVTTVKASIGFIKTRKLNPDYDDSQPYIPRSERKEWDAIGLLGKLCVRDDGTCVSGGYAAVGENGYVTASASKTNMRVLSRVNDGIIRVLLK